VRGCWGLFLGACTAGGVDGKADSDLPTDTEPTVDTEVSVPLDADCELVTGRVRGAEGTVDFDVEVIAEGLEIPWSIGFLPDGAMLVTERAGPVRRIEADGELRAAPVLEVDVSASGEGGLLGLAVHPDFETNRWFYLYYTGDVPSGTVNRVARYELNANGLGATFDRIVLDDIPAGVFHDGGRLRFGPDGKLYVLTGDARNPPLAQDQDSLAGKVLRLEDDGTVPTDNPTPGSPVYLSGIRNTQGLDWRDDGRVVVTDHGPSNGTGEGGRSGHDELSVVEPGANLGWPDIYACEEAPGMVTPSITWARATPPGGAAIYRGTEIPEFQGDVLIGVLGIDDPSAQQLHRVRLDEAGNVLLHETYMGDGMDHNFGRLRDVIMGPDGGLYVTTSNCDGRGDCGQGDRVLRIGRR
jgi:glucose/arabinose dehydrogenase